MSRIPLIIGVIGAGQCEDNIYQLAVEVGEEIAKRDAILVCGGLGGVMEAACRGAKEVGGTTLGILPGNYRHEANPHLSYSVVTGLNEARNSIVAKSSDAIIAIDGHFGTLSEIA